MAVGQYSITSSAALPKNNRDGLLDVTTGRQNSLSNAVVAILAVASPRVETEFPP
jgi:hypothetical protein